MKENPPIESAHTIESKNREETAARAVEFLRRTHAYEYVKDFFGRERREGDFEKFRDFLSRLNGIIRDISIKERTTDGEDVFVGGFVDSHFFPRQGDKEELLKYAYMAIPDTAPGDEKYMMAAAINAVHLFNDGNGRLSRIVYQLLAGHASEEYCLGQIEIALKNDGRYVTPTANPGLIQSELEDTILKKYGWEPGVYDHLGEINGGIATAGPPSIEGIPTTHPFYRFIKEFADCASKDMRYSISAIHSVLDVKEIRSILIPGLRPVSLAKMAESLNEQQWKDLLETYWRIKKEYVQQVVDLFVQPERYTVTKEDGSEVALRDIFLARIKEFAQR